MSIGDVNIYLDKLTFPVSKGEIRDCAARNGAPTAMLNAIDSLPHEMFSSYTEIHLDYDHNLN